VPRNPDSTPVVVTAVALRTPVGNDAVQTAAAVRAGINRFARWQGLGESFEDEAGVIASRLPEDLGDVAWVEKAEELIATPIHEALWQAELYDFGEVRKVLPRARVVAYVAPPDPGRPGVSDSAYRLFSIEAREHCIAPARADEVHLIPGEHAAGLAALARAAADLRAGQADFAVVGAVDSLLHAPLLSSLLAEGRLKSPARPAGLIPGEGAAVLLLERGPDAARRRARPLASLGTVSLQNEAEAIGPGQPIRAEAAARAIRAVLAENGGPGRIHRVIADLTGERWRSLEWAMVETRCLGELPADWQLWHPADCLGDTGAASALANVVLAVRAFARRYGGSDGIMISAASAAGQRAATCVFPAEAAA
jgi:3-oxoacyl-[acyl-carrier-protein] synthase-1